MPDVFGASGQFSIDALNNQSQNNINNLYTGGGFGAQTNYYSGLGAQYSAAGMSPYGVFSDTGGGASPYQTTPDVFNTGASGFNYPGAGSIDWSSFQQPATPYQTSPNVFSQGASGFNYPDAGNVDWSTLARFSQPAPQSAADFGAGMFGGLTGSSGAYQGPGIDWSNLFSGGSKSVPNAPQQAPAVDWSNFQSPSNSYNTFQGAGTQAPSPAQPPYAFSDAPKLPDAQKLVGYDPNKGFSAGAPQQQQQPADFGSLFGQGVGGTSSGPVGSSSFDDRFSAAPQQAPQPDTPATQARTYDFAPMFKSGGGGEFGAGGGDVSGTGDAKAGSLGGNAFSYNPYATGGQGGSVNQSPDALAAQARARLASLMGGGDTTPVETKPELPAAPPVVASDEPVRGPGESAREAGGPATSDAATGAVPLPQARPAGADAPRPPGDVPEFPAARLAPNGKEPEAFIVHHTSGRGTAESVVNSWANDPDPRRKGVGTQYIMDRDGVIHDVAAEFGYHATGQALPSATGTLPGSQGLGNANIVGMEIIANNARDVTPAQLQVLQQFANTRYPDTPFYGHGEISTNKEADEGVKGAQLVTQSRPPLFNFDWSNAPIPDPAAGPPLRPSANIPQARSDPEVAAALQAQASRFGIPAESIPAVLGLESNWNPQAVSKNQQNFGVAQMGRDDFKTAGGTLGGMTFEQYQRAPLAKQIAAYGDFIAASPKSAYLDYASGDPALTSAILQAIQFSPQKLGGDWSDALLAGNTGVPIARNQASELGNTSVDAMRAAFAKRIAGAG